MDRATSHELARIIETVVKEYFVPQMKLEEERVQEAYDDMQKKLDLVMLQVSDLRKRMADSSRCWNCGAALPRSD